MATKGDTQDRFGPPAYENECERLCSYLKNDSLVRWYGFSQQQIDEARAALAARRPFGTYTPKLRAIDESAADNASEERRRVKNARQSNAAYLDALRQAHG